MTESKFLSLLHDYIYSYMTVSRNASPNTIRAYKSSFRLLIKYMSEYKSIMADEIQFTDLDFTTLSDFFDWLVNERKVSSSTRNNRLAALVSFSEYAQNRDFDAASVFRTSVLRVGVRKSEKKPRPFFTREEMMILLNLPDESTATGVRNKVLLGTMYGTGARVQEMCDLTVGNVRFENERAMIELHGKGSKYRRVVVGKACANILKEYIHYRRLEGSPKRHIFSSQTHEKMTISCIEEIVKKYLRIAKEQHPDLFLMNGYTPHSIRHTTATHMIQEGVPIMAIKNFLGHSNVQTTQIYAEMAQNTVDRYVTEWNDKWFPTDNSENQNKNGSSLIPDFLKY